MCARVTATTLLAVMLFPSLPSVRAESVTLGIGNASLEAGEVSDEELAEIKRQLKQWGKRK